jgi:hypothetical protein
VGLALPSTGSIVCLIVIFILSETFAREAPKLS